MSQHNRRLFPLFPIPLQSEKVYSTTTAVEATKARGGAWGRRTRVGKETADRTKEGEGSFPPASRRGRDHHARPPKEREREEECALPGILGSGGRMRKGGEGEGARTGRWEKRKLRPRERIGKGDAATSSREHLSHLLPLFPPSVGEL